MTWGFDEWEGRELVPAGASLGRVDVRKGAVPAVATEAGLAVRMTVPKGYSGSYRAVMRTRTPLAAPFTRGTPVADLVVTPDGLPPQTTPLIASANVDSGGWWARARTGFYRLTGL
jgi:D-alanyl-D-alanine carboxypeptidase (penicillin-binding protein 5/6)